MPDIPFTGLAAGVAFLALGLLGLLAAVYLAVETVLEHAARTPGAAKALFEHVFVPIFIGELPEEPAPDKPTNLTAEEDLPFAA